MNNGINFWFNEPFEQRLRQTSKGPVEYADVGQGAPILYFHGNDVGNDAALLLEKSLLDDRFRLIAPNRPGYYGTPLAGRESAAACADLACALLDELGLDKVMVIGTSGGGPAACQMAARHPERCAGLVLQCALAHPLVASKWMPRAARRMSFIFRHLRFFRPLLKFGHRLQTRKRAGGSGAADCMTPERFAELSGSPELQSLDPLISAAMVRCAQQPAGIENDWAMWGGPPWLTPGNVIVPTLVLHDPDDPVVPWTHAEWAQRCIADARLCELHVGGHLIWIGDEAEKMRCVRKEFILQQLDGAHASRRTESTTTIICGGVPRR